MSAEQGDLFASPPPRPVRDHHLPPDGGRCDPVAPGEMVARSIVFDDPPAQRASLTSVAAGEAIRPVVTRLRAKVLQALYVGGPLTDERIALTAGLNPSTERPRRIECLEAGWIRQSETDGLTAAGRRAAQWVITVAGQEALAVARGLGRG